MANRPRGYGLSAEVKEKLDAKYEVDKEQEVRLWMEAILGEPLDKDVSLSEPLGPKRFHLALKDGIKLCKLANVIMAPKTIKYNTSNLHFKQMENINLFLQACESYGVAKTDLFQTVNLYENQNLWQVILTIYALGRKCQLKNFNGPVLGPKEAQRNTREFTEEQLNAGHTVIGLQMGTNKGASQKGMSFGTTRHIADITVDEASKEGQSVIGLQMGTNKGASQKGMSFGTTRHIADIAVDEASKEGQSVIGLQMGTNKGASQKGMSFGTTRHIADIVVEGPSKEGQNIIGLQMGSNQGANQSGINFGKSRGIMGTDK